MSQISSRLPALIMLHNHVLLCFSAVFVEVNTALTNTAVRGQYLLNTTTAGLFRASGTLQDTRALKNMLRSSRISKNYNR